MALSASPPRPAAWAMAWALSGFRVLGVDQDDLQRRVLEHAVEAFRVDEAHRQQRRMQRRPTRPARSAGSSWRGKASAVSRGRGLSVLDARRPVR